MRSNKTFQPTWWSDQHESAWERVKAAMRRDFEQTKNDFSGGPDLDQDVGDTLKQAAGVVPLPLPGAKTPPSAAETKKQQQEWRDEQKKDRVDEKKPWQFADDQAEKQEKREVHQQNQRDQKRMLDELNDDDTPTDVIRPAFDDVEAPLSFGYAARTQYESRFPIWTPALEDTLRTEWTAGAKDKSWDDVSVYVRRGFEAPHNP